MFHLLHISHNICYWDWSLCMYIRYKLVSGLYNCLVCYMKIWVDYFLACPGNIYVPGNTSKENKSRGERKRAAASHSLCVLPDLSHWCPQMASCHFQLLMWPVLVQGVLTHSVSALCVYCTRCLQMRLHFLLLVSRSGLLGYRSCVCQFLSWDYMALLGVWTKEGSRIVFLRNWNGDHLSDLWAL